ncbi:hypothetical protein [Sphingomonas sp. Y38-1Y]|uniref:hypothetical protein n=1 Tax=Sphingomonas sp. Y38-1Y TaxID=3078265 RepID=UPI0028E2CB8A|nr:hypothetical protein [Sphingomonas sp. Y38-1Y]
MVRPSPLARDLALAGALAGVMTLGWWWVRRAALAMGVLPDGDDAARLQQVRDWLAGQPFGDLAQHRFGIDGLSMHWSRLADLGPAALSATLGAPVMLVLWPALLFAAFLFLSARIARAVGAGPVDAAVLAALAYPATTLFAPGRIDHHGLQMVLLAAFALGLIGRRPMAGGIVAGIAAALSVAIGMETVPVLAIGCAAAVIGWIRGEDARIAGLGAAMLLALAAFGALLAPGDWASAPCDGFARASWRAASLGALTLLALGAIGSAVTEPRGRLLAAIAAGLACAIGVALVSPACLSPYGAVDSTLSRLWLAQVGEAQPLLAADPRWAIGYAGAGVAGLLAAAFAARDPRAWTLAALVGAGVATAFLQLRGAYAAAALAPPLVALALARARAASPLAALPVWIVGAGLVWPLAAGALPIADPPVIGPACDDAAQARAMRALPPGRVLGPVDLGPWLIAATPHHAIAAPYHRNTAGNLAAYRLFAAPPGQARAIARSVRADYIVACPAALATMRVDRGLGAALASGRSPAWLAPAGVPNVWRVR